MFLLAPAAGLALAVSLAGFDSGLAGSGKGRADGSGATAGRPPESDWLLIRDVDAVPLPGDVALPWLGLRVSPVVAPGATPGAAPAGGARPATRPAGMVGAGSVPVRRVAGLAGQHPAAARPLPASGPPPVSGPLPFDPPPFDPHCRPVRAVGMIDLAVDPDHPALRGRRVTQRDYGVPRPRGAGSDHGTMIAAMLVGDTPAAPGGLAPEAQLLVGGILGQTGTGTLRLELRHLMLAIDWMMAQGVRVVNMSFETGENPLLSMVLQRAADRGAVLVAAAGNGGPDAPPAFPAAHPDVIAVTAIDARGDVYRHANRGHYVDFSAPGVDLPVRPGAARRSGTSFAAPHVAALAARLLESGVPARPDAMRQALAAMAEDLGRPGRDEIFGHGHIPPARCPGPGVPADLSWP